MVGTNDSAYVLVSDGENEENFEPAISHRSTADSHSSIEAESVASDTQSLNTPEQVLHATASLAPETHKTRERNSSFSLLSQRARDSIRPSSHSLLEKSTGPTGTAREYLHRRQRWRLWRLTIWEFINTVILCVIYFVILYIYSKKITIDVTGRRVFNALVTAVSLLLGVNLAASLRSYAKLLRWRILAAQYRPLETFDLVLGCDSLMNVLKLLWKAGRPGRWWLPSLTQILCVLWLMVHLSATLLVGMVGLNYNLDQSTDWFLIANGTISILNLEALSSGNYANDLSVVQTWGVRGAAAYAISYQDSEYEQSYYSDYSGETFYYFQDQNANDSRITGVSSRYVQGNAYCRGYNVIEGGYGNLSHILYNDGAQSVNFTLGELPGPSGLYVSSALNSTCGDRCVDIFAFQAQASPQNPSELLDVYSTVSQPAFFVCNNTFSQVADSTNSLTSDYLVSDLVARMLAGGMGWSDHSAGLIEDADSQTEYMVYTNGSDWAFRYTPTETDMANWISSFTMGSVSIMDASVTFPRKYIENGRQPIKAQILHVTWRYAGAILAVIPFLHFWTLLAVIIWANKAIIKDDTHLASAKLYHNFLTQLGNRGCLLQAEEIVKEVGNPNVVYGWIGDRDEMKHVDIFEETRGVRIQRAFVEGWYDGLGEKRHGQGKSTALEIYRDIDARHYF